MIALLLLAIASVLPGIAPAATGDALGVAVDDAAWDREADRIRASARPAGERAEALAQLAVASRDIGRIRAVVRELERFDLSARDRLALQAQLQEQERRLRSGLPVRMPALSGRATPPRNVPSAEYRGQASLPPPPGGRAPAMAPLPAPVPPPASPLAPPGPAVIGTEDLAGAWTSDGRRLLRQGPLYVDPQTGRRCLPSGGTCILQ